MGIKNIVSKQIAAFLVICLTMTIFGGFGTLAFAEGEVPVNIDFVVEKTEIYEGGTFRVNVKLDFEDLSEAEGILMLKCGLRYNPEVLDILDPNTMLPIEVSESGTPVEGQYFIFGDLGVESNFSAIRNSDGRTLVLLYGSRNSDGNIFAPGNFVQFAFQAKTDLTINNSLFAGLEIVNPEVYFSNSDIEAAPDAGSAGVNIVPMYKMAKFGDTRQNTTLNLSGLSLIGTESGEPLVISISDANGNVIEEKEAELTTLRYEVNFDITEELYPVGVYTVKYSHKNTSLTAQFNVTAKATEPEPPTTEPDEPGSDDNNNTSPGTTDKPGNLPTDTTKPEPDDKEDKDDEGDEPTVPDVKPEVVYPSDIAKHWAEDNIKYVYDNALMNGYEDGTFGADNSITRAEFSTVIARLLGLEQDTNSADFADCDGHWAKGYIGALAAKNIVGGVSETEFAPDENITREQIAVILSRALSLEEPFDSMAVFMDDDAISDWAYSDVYKVLDAGLMKGDESGFFNPLANATRAEVATVIYRLHSK